MSLIIKTSNKNDEETTDTQEDDEVNTEEYNSKSKDFLKTSQTSEKTTRSPLTVFKEDFCQFKEEMMKVFKDTDVNLTTSQSGKKRINPLGLLTEDFIHIKEDISNVFKTSVSKEKDSKDAAVKEDSSKTFRLKTSKTERAKEPLKSLFRRDGSLLKTSKNTKDMKDIKKNKKEVQDHFRKQNQERDECDGSDHMMFVSNAAVKPGKNKSWTNHLPVMSEEEDDASETPPFETLSSGLTLLCPTENLSFSMNLQTDDLRSPKNFAFYLTLDPKTANAEICLSEDNRKATRLWWDHQTLEHPERFENCPQVLCREGLLDSVYWEVVWSGGADIGVTYNSISRDGDMDSCLLGHNEQSWSLECSEGGYTPCHNRKRFKSSLPELFTNRVGVYLNWTAGSLSFYCVSRDTMVHLHTFTSTFTEPLYPGFWVWAYDGSVMLCQVELGWERLLQ